MAPNPDEQAQFDVPYLPPLDFRGLLAWFRVRALEATERVGAQDLQIAVRLPHGSATVRIADEAAHHRLRVILRGCDPRDHDAALTTVRRLLDLDADTAAVDQHLWSIPALRPLVELTPGIRIPGTPTPVEALLRALTGQQVSVAAGRVQLQRLVAPTGDGALRPFPTAEQILDTDPSWYAGPQARRTAILHALRLAADGGLEPAADPGEVAQRLLDVTGIGPWTVAYTLLRGYGAADVDLSGDRAVVVALQRLGIDANARHVLAAAAPWRSYAALHVWQAHARTAAPS